MTISTLAASRVAAVGAAPAPALHAIDAAHVVLALARRIVEPFAVGVGVGIPGFRSQGAEIGRIVVAAQIAEQLGEGRFPVALARRDQGELVVPDIVFKVGIDDRQAALARAFVGNPFAFVDDLPA